MVICTAWSCVLGVCHGDLHSMVMCVRSLSRWSAQHGHVCYESVTVICTAWSCVLGVCHGDLHSMVMCVMSLSWWSAQHGHVCYESVMVICTAWSCVLWVCHGDLHSMVMCVMSLPWWSAQHGHVHYETVTVRTMTATSCCCEMGLVGCLVACLMSWQHASESQAQICSDNCTCCHTEIEVVDQTFHRTQWQYTDTGPTSPSADPIMPGAWQGSHWSANF